MTLDDRIARTALLWSGGRVQDCLPRGRVSSINTYLVNNKLTCGSADRQGHITPRHTGGFRVPAAGRVEGGELLLLLLEQALMHVLRLAIGTLLLREGGEQFLLGLQSRVLCRLGTG